jgi:hypothetical protein
MYDLQNHRELNQHIISTLHQKVSPAVYFPSPGINLATASAVLFLLGKQCIGNGRDAEPCLILNKRSVKVKQPGDLCCPGGGITPRLDKYLAKISQLPFFPLTKWPHWSEWQRDTPREASWLAMLWACGLREGFEEMRLNPFGLKLLGLLPRQSLVMFDRVIYPMVTWINRQARFWPNWEVEKIVYIPLRDLLNSQNYARYRISFDTDPDSTGPPPVDDYPCYIQKTGSGTDLLWGATYRITMIFLEYIFDFRPPAHNTLSIVNGSLNTDYLTGQQ